MSPYDEPTRSLYMMNNAQGSIHTAEGESEGDKGYFYFTEHPGFPSYFVITSKKWPTWNVYMTYGNYVNGWSADPGAAGYWFVAKDQARGNDQKEVISLTVPLIYPNFFAYASGTVIAAVKGDPGAKARFTRTAMSRQTQVKAAGPPVGRWRYLKTELEVPNGVVAKRDTSYTTSAETSVSVTASVDVAYLMVTASLSSTFAAKYATSTSVADSVSVTGPVTQQVFYRQVLDITAADGKVYTIQTPHATWVASGAPAASALLPPSAFT